MFQGGDLKDQMLKSYIDQVFDRYDTDRSGTLDEKQMTFFFNDLFKSLNMNMVVNEQQALEAIKSIDQDFDGTVNKAELFSAFKAMINGPQQQQPPRPPPPQNYYGGYNGYPPQYYGGYQQQGYQPNPYMNNQGYNQQYPHNNNPNMPPQNMQQSNTGYMSQSNGYMNQSNPYMNQSNGYMNQSNPYANQGGNGNQQPYNPYNQFKK